jgi:hypothetical protein
MSKRNARKVTVTKTLPAGADVDVAQQQFKRWQEEQRFLIEQHPDLAEKARKLGILPSGPIEPPSKQ